MITDYVVVMLTQNVLFLAYMLTNYKTKGYGCILNFIAVSKTNS